VQLVRWPNDLDLGTKSTSLCVADGGLLRRDHAGVRYHRGIGRFQNPAVAFDERGQVGTADFLLPFEDAEEVHGQGMAGRDIGFDGLQMRKELPLVVGRATTIENIVFDCRRERRCSPIAERLSWQYVVVTVDDKCWPSWSTAPRGNDDGMARGGNDANVIKPNLFEMPSQPGGASVNIFGTLRLGTHAREAKEVCKLPDKAFSVGTSISECARRIQGSPHRVKVTPHRADQFSRRSCRSHRHTPRGSRHQAKAGWQEGRG